MKTFKSTYLLSYYFKLICWTGVYPYKFDAARCVLSAGKRTISVLLYSVNFSFLSYYTVLQFGLIIRSWVKGNPTIMIVSHSAWVFGSLYGFISMIHQATVGKQYLSLVQEFLNIQHRYLEPEVEYRKKWHSDVLTFAFCALNFGWIGSIIGLVTFYFMNPHYPMQLFSLTLDESVDPLTINRLSPTCLLFGLHEMMFMVCNWGNTFSSYVTHHLIHSGFAYGLQANSFQAYKDSLERDESFDDREMLLEQKIDEALEFNREMYRFYKRYNRICSVYHLLYMTDGMFLSWACLYIIIAFFAHLSPFVLLVQIVNVLAIIAYILCHKHQACLEVRNAEFLYSWREGVAAFSLGIKRKYYKTRLMSHPPIYYSYAGLCRMEPSTVLELLYHYTNHVNVFLRL